jgi:hypothetical protein
MSEIFHGLRFDDGADGFFDLSDRYASLDTKQDSLVGIEVVVSWEEFRSALILDAGRVHCSEASQ